MLNNLHKINLIREFNIEENETDIFLKYIYVTCFQWLLPVTAAEY
jgi:hypothetical protein